MYSSIGHVYRKVTKHFLPTNKIYKIKENLAASQKEAAKNVIEEQYCSSAASPYAEIVPLVEVHSYDNTYYYDNWKVPASTLRVPTTVFLVD